MVSTYRLDDFKAKLRAKKEDCSYTALEESYGVNRWYLWNLINDEGYEPPEWVQTALGIQTFHPAPVCLKCGIVHTSNRCTSGNHKKRNRLSINLDDPFSAGMSIERHMDKDKIIKLMEYLERWILK